MSIYLPEARKTAPHAGESHREWMNPSFPSLLIYWSPARGHPRTSTPRSPNTATFLPPRERLTLPCFIRMKAPGAFQSGQSPHLGLRGCLACEDWLCTGASPWRGKWPQSGAQQPSRRNAAWKRRAETHQATFETNWTLGKLLTFSETQSPHL